MKIREAYIDALTFSATRLFKRVYNANQIELTHADVMALICPAEHRALLTEARKVGQSSSYTPEGVQVEWHGPFKEAFGFESIDLRLEMNTWGGEKPPFVPRWPCMQRDADPELVDKITSWVIRRIEIGRQFGVVKGVINHLSMQTGTFPRMRFYFPAVVPLMRLNPHLEKYADQFMTAKPPTIHVTMTPALRAACTAASATVASALLLPEELEKDVARPVVLSCQEGNFTLNGFYIQPM